MVESLHANAELLGTGVSHSNSPRSRSGNETNLKDWRNGAYDSGKRASLEAAVGFVNKIGAAFRC